MTSIEPDEPKAVPMLHEIGHLDAKWQQWDDVAKWIERDELKAVSMLPEFGHLDAKLQQWNDVAKWLAWLPPKFSQAMPHVFGYLDPHVRNILVVDSAENVVIERSFADHAVEAPQSDSDALRKEVEDLRIRNERLRSLVAQERRIATHESRRNDQLLAQLDAERESRNDLLNTLKEMAKANNALQSALTADRDGHMRMFESHRGVVMHVNDDGIVVTYSVDGEYVDQTYSRDQFIGRQLPKKGDRLGIYVHVAELPRNESNELTTGDRADVQPRHRKKAIRPPREF